MRHYQTTVDYMCVPACAKMILDDNHSIGEIAKLLGFQPGVGTNRWNLINLQAWGYNVRVGLASLPRLRDWLNQGIHPLLFVALMGRYNEPHSIVLGAINDDTATIHDPVQPGPIDIPLETLLKCWEMRSRFAAVILPGEVAVCRKNTGVGGAGFIYDAAGNPLDVYSLAPARQTNFGRIEKVSGVLLSGNTIVGAQPECNTLAGLWLAWKNIRFPQIRIHARNNRVLEPAEQDYFAVNLAATDTNRGYVWAGKEFLTTTVSLKINNENGTILVDIEGEASTWGPDGVAGEYPSGPPEEPPDTNPPIYGPDWPPGATPENPDGDPPDWATPAGSGEVAYLVLENGHVIRAINPTASDSDNVVYMDLGEVDSSGLYWIALDEFDPTNRAMVCGPSGIWGTTDLSAGIPTWVQEVAAPAGWDFTMVRSSPVQDRLWMACAFEDGVAVGAWWTINDGASWDSRTDLLTAPDVPRAWPYLEMSSHDANTAWVNFWRDDGMTRVARTQNMWTGFTLLTPFAGCFQNAAEGDLARPPSIHPYTSNADDLRALWGGRYTPGSPPDHTRFEYCTIDTAACSCRTWCSPITPNNADVRDVGCFKSAANQYWALAWCESRIRFGTSPDGVNWTTRTSWVRAIADPITDMLIRAAADSRDNENYFYLTDDGIAGPPIWFSSDGGDSFQAQRGNWVPLCNTNGWVDADTIIWCIAPIFDT